MDEGSLVQWKAGMSCPWRRVGYPQEQRAPLHWPVVRFCLFISHQWLSYKAADPLGEQLDILRVVLRKLIDGKISAMSGSPSPARHTRGHRGKT